MIVRALRRVAVALLAAVLLVLAFVLVQFNRRPPLEPYQSLMLPVSAEVTGVRVRFAGVTTLVFDDGETAWMTDGFFSRPPAGQLLFGRIGPDEARIEEGLRRLSVSRLMAVIPVHSHYDHAMDSALVAKRTAAMLVGGRSTLNLGRGLGLSEDRLHEVNTADSLQLGKFTLRFIASRHSPTPYSDGHSREDIETPLTPPAHATAWREGEVWSIAVTHSSGRRFLIQGSAGIVPGALSGVKADTVFLGTGTLGKKTAAYRTAYWDETVTLTGAKRVIPVHWDDFTHPLNEPLVASPYLIDDFDVVMNDLQARGRGTGIEVRLPPTFVPFTP